MKREKLSSRLGFIMLSAGCAIGVGNVWKFPYVAGENGGGFFVLFYLLFLLILGVPVLTMEFSMGRAAKTSPIKMYQKLQPTGTKWQWHGYLSLLGNVILMMFYTSVTGWMLQYFVKSAAGEFENTNREQVDAIFDNMVSSPETMLFYMGIVVLLGAVICSFKLANGLERITKYMMIALMVLMVVLSVNSIFLDGGAEGLKFYLMPDFDNMMKIGIGNVIVAAMNQAFFTLSLGIGSMAIFGSYLDRKRSLMGEAVTVIGCDTAVALCAGLIIFPACFANGIRADSGPDLIFKTLPHVFDSMPLGRLWGSLFFVFMSFAALSTIFAVFENINAMLRDLFNWNRKKASLTSGIGLFILSIPCVLGFNLLSDFKPFGGTSNIMNLEDFIVSNILLPLGAFVYVLFCVIPRYGWGWKNFTKEANKGKGLKVQNWMRGYVTFVLPVIILVLFIVGLVQKFA